MIKTITTNNLYNLCSAAVAILAILRSKTNAFEPSTVIIEQYRPPLDKIAIGTFSYISWFFMYQTNVIELPAGSYHISNQVNASYIEKDLWTKVKVQRKQLSESCSKKQVTRQLG